LKQKSRPITNIVIPALDRSVLKRQLNLSPGLAKIAPYLTCHRANFSAKVPGLVAGWLRQVTLTAHTRWPLAGIKNNFLDNYCNLTTSIT
jgi:hypothetical protein